MNNDSTRTDLFKNFSFICFKKFRLFNLFIIFFTTFVVFIITFSFRCFITLSTAYGTFVCSLNSVSLLPLRLICLPNFLVNRRIVKLISTFLFHSTFLRLNTPNLRAALDAKQGTLNK